MKEKAEAVSSLLLAIASISICVAIVYLAYLMIGLTAKAYYMGVLDILFLGN
jgi:hypothetical protein